MKSYHHVSEWPKKTNSPADVWGYEMPHMTTEQRLDVLDRALGRIDDEANNLFAASFGEEASEILKALRVVYRAFERTSQQWSKERAKALHQSSNQTPTYYIINEEK